MSAGRGRASRLVLLVSAGLAVGAGGLHLGTTARQWWGAAQGPSPPPSRLVEGATFPDVPVVGEDGTAHGTRALVAGRGSVVMFLDLDCPPCGEMASRWQAALDQGELSGVPVIGIATAEPGAVLAYKDEHGLRLPIFADPAGLFEGAPHHVSSFPFRVVVGRSGRIEATSVRPDEEPDAASLRELLER